MRDALAVNPFRASPAWCLIGIVAGTLGALLMVPADDFHVAGELRWSGLVLSIGLLLGPAAAAVRSLSAGMRTEHVLLFGLVYWILLDLVQGAYDLPQAPRGAVLGAIVSVGMFAFALCAGSTTMDLLRRPPPRSGSIRGDLPSRFVLIAVVVLFALGSIRYLAPCRYNPACVIELFYYQRGAGWLVAWVLQNQFGDWASLVHALRFCGYLVLPLAVALHHLERRTSWRVVLAFALGLLFVVLMMREGGRRGVGTVVMASGLLWILLHARVRMRHILSLAAIGALLLLVLQAMLVWRSVGIGKALEEGMSLEAEDREGLIAVDRNFLYLVEIQGIVPDRHPYTAADGLLYLATLPIPRVIWPGKPTDRGIDLPAVLGKAGRGFTITNSAVGDFYLIGGNVAVLLGGFVFGVLARLCSTLLERTPSVQNRLIFAVATMTLFVGLRALSEIVITGYALAAVLALLGARHLVLRAAAAPPKPFRAPGAPG